VFARLVLSKDCPAASATLLDIPLRELEKVLYFESYIVIDPATCRD
jgi:hypothetical protein